MCYSPNTQTPLIRSLRTRSVSSRLISLKVSAVLFFVLNTWVTIFKWHSSLKASQLRQDGTVRHNKIQAWIYALFPRNTGCCQNYVNTFGYRQTSAPSLTVTCIGAKKGDCKGGTHITLTSPVATFYYFVWHPWFTKRETSIIDKLWRRSTWRRKKEKEGYGTDQEQHICNTTGENQHELVLSFVGWHVLAQY